MNVQDRLIISQLSKIIVVSEGWLWFFYYLDCCPLLTNIVWNGKVICIWIFMCKFTTVVLTNLLWWSNRFKSGRLFIKDFWVQRKRNSCSFKSFYETIFLFSVAKIILCCICSSVISALAILNKSVFYLCLNLYAMLQLNRFLTIYTPCHICVYILLFLRERFIVSMHIPTSFKETFWKSINNLYMPVFLPYF